MVWLLAHEIEFKENFKYNLKVNKRIYLFNQISIFKDSSLLMLCFYK